MKVTFLEFRSKWPKEFRPVLLLQLVLIALGGVTLFQVLILVGIKNTSPAIAFAMPNLAPGIIFIIAWCLRSLNCMRLIIKKETLRVEPDEEDARRYHVSFTFDATADGRCDISYILLEMDRILRPEGTAIFRDAVEVLVKIQSITNGMRWKSKIMDHEDGPFNPEKILVAVKTYWTGGATK